MQGAQSLLGTRLWSGKGGRCWGLGELDQLLAAAMEPGPPGHDGESVPQTFISQSRCRDNLEYMFSEKITFKCCQGP